MKQVRDGRKDFSYHLNCNLNCTIFQKSALPWVNKSKAKGRAQRVCFGCSVCADKVITLLLLHPDRLRHYCTSTGINTCCCSQNNYTHKLSCPFDENRDALSFVPFGCCLATMMPCSPMEIFILMWVKKKLSQRAICLTDS